MASSSSSSSPTKPDIHHAEKTWKTSGRNLMRSMEINDNKAGMEGLDKDKINQIIYEASKGSKFYENERKKEQQLDLKIEKLKSYASSIESKELMEGQMQADLLLGKLKMERDLSHTIVHVDMDAFYAAVEMRDDPSLQSVPMAVGGMGMLSTSNYLARKFGVRAALPGFIGMKLCPSLIIVKPNFEKYTAVSRQTRTVLEIYDPNFCPMSLDEAYLDFTQHLEMRINMLVSERTFILRDKSVSNCGVCVDVCACNLNSVLLPSILSCVDLVSLISDESEFRAYVDNYDSGSSLKEEVPQICTVCGKKFPKYHLKVYGLTIEEAVLEMRNRIEELTGLTASAGIAPNTMLAKICSDKRKPNGQYRIMPDVAEIQQFIDDLPIRKVSGIGKVTEKLLGALGVTKCCNIFEKRSLLFHLFSSTSFHHFLSISLGIGSTIVERDDERKSISTEQTFNEISDPEILCSKCEEMCIEIADDLKKEKIKGKTLTLKLKTIDFEVKTRSITMQEFTNDATVIYSLAKKILFTEIKIAQPSPLRLRLMGVRMSKFLSQSQSKSQSTVNSLFNNVKKKEVVNESQHSGINVVDNETPAGNEFEDEEEEEDFSRPVSDITNFESSNKTNADMEGNSGCIIKKRVKNAQSNAGNILMLFAKQKELKPELNSNKCDSSTSSSIDQLCSQGNKRMFLPSKSSDFKSNPERQKVSSIEQSQINSSLICASECNKNAQSKSVLSKQETGPSKDTPTSNISYESSNSIDNGFEISGTSTSTDKSKCLTCPVCAKSDSTWNVDSLNRHIDMCLNKQVIKDMLQDERTKFQESIPSASKRLRTKEEDQNPKKKVQRSVLSYFHS